jgi:hypothetical protein
MVSDAKFVGIQISTEDFKSISTGIICSDCGHEIRESPCEYCGGHRLYIYIKINPEE